MISKKTYQLVLPIAALAFLLGVMVVVVHLGSELLSANRQHRESVIQWINLQNQAIHELESYLESRDPAEYEHFKQNYRNLKEDVEISLPVLDPRVPIDSAARQLADSREYTPETAYNIIYYARKLSSFPQIKQAILAWRNLGNRVFALEGVHRQIHQYVKSGEDDPEQYQALKRRITSFQEVSNSYENAMMSGLNYTTKWLEKFLRNATLILSLILFAGGTTLVFYIYRRSSYHQEKYRQLFANAEVAIAYLDEKSTVQEVNEAFVELFGYKPEEIHQKNLDNIIVPTEKKEEAEKVTTQTLQRENTTLTTWRRDKDGNRIDVIIGGVPIVIGNKLRGIFGLYYDISELVEVQNDLESSLKEKQLLIQEIHHRVKNNLAIIAGLLQLQIDSTEDSNSRSILHDSQSRIYSMAMIHEMLYQGENFSHVSFKKYTEQLIDHHKTTHLDDSIDIDIELKSEAFSLNINQAIPCGLIINELITNAIEHAFDPGDRGTIEVNLSRDNHSISLTVSDDGKGMSSDSTSNQSSIGLSIVRTLVRQLEGEIEFTTSENAPGTDVSITFTRENLQGSAYAKKV